VKRCFFSKSQMPNNDVIIPEIDVLLATIAFLKDRGVTCYGISPPRGQGIDTQSAQRQIWELLNSIGIKRTFFSNEGPDYIGISDIEWWQVECKGAGTGVQQTQRNSFDRALASTVSYYEEKPSNLPKEYAQYTNARTYIGLALPASKAYLNELKKRVRLPLRKALNLWVLLYEPNSKKIRAVSPENNY
jgi:hypothetical protein